MSDKRSSKRPKRASKTLEDLASEHFVSAYAFHLEEAVVHLHAAFLDSSVPKAERLHIAKIKRNLATLHQRELGRRSSASS
jgi:hypothetical protein